MNVRNVLPCASIKRTLISPFACVSTSSLKSLTVGFGKIFTSSSAVAVVAGCVVVFVWPLALFVASVRVKPGTGQAGNFTSVGDEDLVESLRVGLGSLSVQLSELSGYELFHESLRVSSKGVVLY